MVPGLFVELLTRIELVSSSTKSPGTIWGPGLFVICIFLIVAI